ncbi:PD-(D/E)XK motif protein [Marinobacter salarius]|uniref:PD-(D/E)XK motif protein n=1 Tax=Marinobacter salarius TaxID=1420917 RepID=UPI0018F188E1|nr:PD-(D/E)XK motif protein [Marinobacter salarius]MBJ7276208.1 PD-(D/E)XK motif protein [Marinobacter salarius]|tara:strand:+ start:5465 stop:6424 length:960 start_codon:yes stop_codon:yes gene_type:complete
MNELDPWKNLGPNDARRVNSSGRFDFFWVVLEANAPGLMLKLRDLPDPLPSTPRLRNLEASFRKMEAGGAFVLGLKELSQVEVFETLCRDVVAAGETGSDLDSALARTIQRTRRWHHLLRGGAVGGLSVEEQRGLVGELSFLRELVTALGPETAVEAWTGPTRTSKDFEFIGTCVEIKTRRAAAKPYVAISSADQLTDVDRCRLFLRVINVTSAVLHEGQSLHDHVSTTAAMFRETDRAFDAWEEAISATGYDPDNQYEGRRWQLGVTTNYEVLEGFPRISGPIPQGVDNIGYSVSLDVCSDYETSDDLIEIIKKGLSQ